MSLKATGGKEGSFQMDNLRISFQKYLFSRSVYILTAQQMVLQMKLNSFKFTIENM